MDVVNIEVKVEPEDYYLSSNDYLNGKHNYENHVECENNLENTKIEDTSILKEEHDIPIVGSDPLLDSVTDSTPTKSRKKRNRNANKTAVKKPPRKRKKQKTCFRCGKKFRETTYEQHAATCTVDRYTYCALCDKSVTTGVFSKHLQTHTPLSERRHYSCDICNLNFTVEGLRAHRRRMHSSEKFEYKRLLCEVCGIFINQSSLKGHYVAHSEEKTHTCFVCGSKYKSKRQLEVHERSHKEKHLKCAQCDYRTYCRTKLKYHLNTHADSRNFPCEYCDKSFKTIAVRKIHTRIHTGERPYACKLCPTAFYDAGNLRKHRLTVHSNGKVTNLRYERRAAKEGRNEITLSAEPDDLRIANITQDYEPIIQ